MYKPQYLLSHGHYFITRLAPRHKQWSRENLLPRFWDRGYVGTHKTCFVRCFFSLLPSISLLLVSPLDKTLLMASHTQVAISSGGPRWSPFLIQHPLRGMINISLYLFHSNVYFLSFFFLPAHFLLFTPSASEASYGVKVLTENLNSDRTQNVFLLVMLATLAGKNIIKKKK